MEYEYDIMKYDNWNNFHTHTYRCKHAKGDVSDMAQRALELGMTKLGMTDHAHIPGEVNHPTHMEAEDLDGYIAACRAADGADEFHGIEIYCGLECDYDPSDEGYYTDFLLGEKKLDFVTGSVHCLKNGSDRMDCFRKMQFGPEQLRIYADLYIKAIESGIFRFMNHPDLYAYSVLESPVNPGWSEDALAVAKEIIAAAKAHDTVLEINTSGLARTRYRHFDVVCYPRREFWEIAADSGIRVIVNTDAHAPENLDLDADYGLQLVRELHLTRVELTRDGFVEV